MFFVLVVGCLVVLFMFTRTIIQEIESFLPERKRIIIDSGLYGTNYRYSKFFERAKKNIIITGQNLRTLLNDENFLPFLRSKLETQPELNIKIVGTSYEILESLAERHANELARSIGQLKDWIEELDEQQRARVTVLFHPGASSLSSMIRDPDDDANGAAIFTAKWLTDVEPSNRIFCVIERWNTPEIFNKLFGGVEGMNIGTSKSLDEMFEHPKIARNISGGTDITQP